MLELAELVKELTGSSSPISFQTLPQDDPKQRRPDIGLAERELSWKPSVELEDGLQLTIDYFQEMLIAGSLNSAETS